MREKRQRFLSVLLVASFQRAEQKEIEVRLAWEKTLLIRYLNKHSLFSFICASVTFKVTAA